MACFPEEELEVKNIWQIYDSGSQDWLLSSETVLGLLVVGPERNFAP